MNIDKLRSLFNEALTHHEHYVRVPAKGDEPAVHFTREDLLESAKKSLSRLTVDEKKKLRDIWIEQKFEEKDFEDLMLFRYMAQTNLFFLCKLLEKYDQVSLNTHEEICNEFFVRKDPTHLKFEEFAKSYPNLKERMLLVPRGGFKSSIDMADCVQWVVAFPEVTILILSGVYSLAKGFVKEIREHFTLDQKGEKKFGPKTMPDGTVSMFQVLFPEHCVEPGDTSSLIFQTPASHWRDKEPTIMAASIEQALSGWHFGIIKLDDVVTNENSNTLERMASVDKQVSIDKAMLHPFGFFDIIGTWYHEADIYGRIFKAEEELRTAEGPSARNVITYLKAALWLTPQAIKEGKILDKNVKKDDVELWFPERLPFEFLIKEWRQHPDEFPIKYLNDPRMVHEVKFPRELLMRRTIPHTQMPHQGLIVTTVDTAYSTKSFADYTVLITALIYGGRFFILDCTRGRFNEYELPKIIAATGLRWKPKRIAIEDSVGVRWLSREIRREMDALRISIPVEYVPLGQGHKNKAKDIKAKPVLRLMLDERLFFLNSSAGLEELYTELEKFPNGTHDDIVSALTILVEVFGAYADMESKIQVAQVDYVSEVKSKDQHDRVYGLGKYSKYNAAFALDDNPVMPNMPVNSPIIPDGDPLSDLFG